MLCERCGRDLAESAAICPSCGTVTSAARPSVQPSTQHGPFPADRYSDPQPMATYDQGYRPPQGYMPPPQQNYGYGPAYNPPPLYSRGPVNVTVVNNYAPPSTKNTGALIVEIILSLFGIYGVGWLMAGESTVGIILLLCSIFLYWPIAIVGTILTFGLGICFFGPLSIAAIILNAILLNNNLNRKATQYPAVQAQAQQMPPQYPPRPQ